MREAHKRSHLLGGHLVGVLPRVDTTLRRRRDEWIEIGAMDELRALALEAYDRCVGLELSDIAVDCCITKA
jgi:hypothetical protein